MAIVGDAVRGAWIRVVVVFLAALAARPAMAAVQGNVSCVPGREIPSASEWAWMTCSVATDDAGTLQITVFSSTATARMRFDANGDISPADMAAIRLAVRNAYRARIAEARSEEISRAQAQQRRGRGSLNIPSAQVE